MRCFWRTGQTITTTYSLTAGKNAITVSPTINNNVEVTVPNRCNSCYSLIMSLELSGTTPAIKGVAGSVSAPAITGDDADTGISFPAADTIKFSAGGVEKFAIVGKWFNLTYKG